MPKETSSYKKDLAFRRHQLFTANPHRLLNIERNAKISKLYRKYSSIRQYIEEQTLEADAFSDILRGLLPDIDARDNVPLEPPPLGTPAPCSNYQLARDPRIYTTVPNYEPDGYSSDNGCSPYPALRVHRTIGNRRIYTPSSHARYFGPNSIKAPYHLDKRSHIFSTLG